MEKEEEVKLIIGSDHGGYHLKNEIKQWLVANDFDVTDAGCDSTDLVDYPDLAVQVALSVGAGEFTRGILVCGTGLGMSMAANKVKGVRAALCNDLYCARYSRLHNDANVLTIGGRVVGSAYAIEIVSTFLSTRFDGGRHKGRVAKIAGIEEEWRS